MRRRSFTAAAMLAAARAQGDAAKPDKSDAFFAAAKVHRLRVDLAPAEFERLRQENRKYVRATLKEEGGKDWGVVGVKMKGAAGSFRPLDQRPALTVNVDKFGGKETFHGLEKFHLNNSEQDGTRLHELLAYDACKAAGVPAARATHARLWLNGRDLGVYVIKEGFDKRFLKRHFAQPNGNLYDGGFCQDLDGPLELDAGAGTGDRQDLKRLADALRHPNPQERWRRSGEALDLDALCRLILVERLLSHWDGYANNCNNYRVYFDPGRGGKAVLMPHGMDQLFGDAGMGLFFHSRALAARVVMQCDAHRRRCRELARETARHFLNPEAALRRIDEVAPRLAAAFAETDKNWSRDFLKHHVPNLKNQLKERAKHVKRILDEPDPEPQKFEGGKALIRDWWGAGHGEQPKVEEAVPPGEKDKAYLIQAGPKGNCHGAWQRTVLLAAGKYRLEGRVRTESVVPLEDKPDHGAGLRLTDGGRNTRVVGTAGWQTLAVEFEVLEDRREVEFAAECRCKSGKTWWDRKGFVLTRR